MKKHLLILTLFFNSLSFAADCMDKAISQYDMNMCSLSKADKADAELNQIYKKILTLVKNDKSALDKTKKAQEAWLKYRKAQIAMYYPPEPQGFYGSFHPVCINSLYTELTENRIKELKGFLKKPVEGDMCARNSYETAT